MKTLTKMISKYPIFFILLFYSTTQSNFVNADGFGYIEVLNLGGFVARFFVTYTYGGIDITRNSGDFLVQQSRIILTPDGATDFRITIQCMVFFGIYADVMVYKLPATGKCFTVHGTTFEPKWNQINC